MDDLRRLTAMRTVGEDVFAFGNVEDGLSSTAGFADMVSDGQWHAAAQKDQPDHRPKGH
jgi:hypothetical protein